MKQSVAACSEALLRALITLSGKWKFNCDDKGELTMAGPARMESIIRFSKGYKDNSHVDLIN